MSDKLRIVLILLVIATNLYSFRQIRQGKMSLNHTLLWIFVSLALLAVALFPEIATWMAGLLGIELPINMVFLFFSLFSIVLFIYLTNVISREGRINRRLTQEVALLERRIRELEAREQACADGEGNADGIH